MKLFKPISVFILFLLIFTRSYSQNCSVNADIDQNPCVNSVIQLHGHLSGTLNGTGSPHWVQVSGPSVILSDPNILEPIVTGCIVGPVYKFRLFARCGDGSLVFDDVNITVRPITTANAGPDASYCPGTYQLQGNAVGTNETGLWTGASAGISISNTASPTSNIVLGTGASGTGNLVWTITNSNGCWSADVVNICNKGGATPVDAGANQILGSCYSGTASTNLAGTYGGTSACSSNQVGHWYVVSGPNQPTISNAAQSNSGISNLV